MVLTFQPSDRTTKPASPLAAILAYEHPSLIPRLQERCEITMEVATELFADTKRFLYLCADSNVPMSPPPAIDACWHHFLLFTKDYARFCDQHFGAFVHHRPRYLGDPPADGSEQRNTIAAAKKYFGKLSKNWDYPVATNKDCDSCKSCSND